METIGIRRKKYSFQYLFIAFLLCIFAFYTSYKVHNSDKSFTYFAVHSIIVFTPIIILLSLVFLIFLYNRKPKEMIYINNKYLFLNGFNKELNNIKEIKLCDIDKINYNSFGRYGTLYVTTSHNQEFYIKNIYCIEDVAEIIKDKIENYEENKDIY